MNSLSWQIDESFGKLDASPERQFKYVAKLNVRLCHHIDDNIVDVLESIDDDLIWGWGQGLI